MLHSCRNQILHATGLGRIHQYNRILSTAANVFMIKKVKSTLEYSEVFFSTVAKNSVLKMSLDPILWTLTCLVLIDVGVLIKGKNDRNLLQFSQCQLACFLSPKFFFLSGNFVSV